MSDHNSLYLGEDYMAHYGVRGMRWGVRNDDDPKPNTASKKTGWSTQKKLAVGAISAASLMTVGGGLTLLQAKRRYRDSLIPSLSTVRLAGDEIEDAVDQLPIPDVTVNYLRAQNAANGIKDALALLNGV